MELKRILTGLAASLLVALAPVKADTNLTIVDFHDGLLTWTNVDPLLYYSVEWLPSLGNTNAWTDSYRGNQDIQSADPTITVPVPMFYRVVGRTSPAHTRALTPGTVAMEPGYYEATNLTQVDLDLSSANIRSGASIFGVAGDSQVVNTASGDAQTGEMLTGKKAWVDGAEVTGSMPNRGAVVITPGTAQQSIPVGYHSGNGSVQGDAALTPANIRAGTSIFGVAGDSQVVNTTSGDARAGDVLAGKKAWVDGVEITGTIPTRTLSPTTDLVEAGYYMATTLGEVEADLVASNVVAGVDLFGVVGLYGQYHSDGFPARASKALWEAFDPGAKAVGTKPAGYFGAVFDGRYLYFVPNDNGSAHGEVLRLDTQGEFSSTNAWSAFDPGANGVGTDPDGYAGGVFDGRYAYFAPSYNGTTYHGEVLRLDTQAEFSSANAWTTYTPRDHGLGDHVGYYGAVFDGRYVYFCPNADAAYHGEVLRYDTQSAFDETNSWAAFDPGNQGVGTDPDGFIGGVFDGRFIYFVPAHNGTKFHSEVLRYDTQSGFNTTNSWSTFDPAANGVGNGKGGFYGGVFDGRYVYLVPYYEGADRYGQVVRYDTQGDFGAASAWQAYDPGSAGVGSDPDGFIGGLFDGRYVYFVPYNSGTGGGYTGEILRYDVQGEFQAPDSWSTYTPKSDGVGTQSQGSRGGAFDGRYIYFVPWGSSVRHGEVLRFDAKNPAGLPDTISGGSFF